jgi:hypothetical protein
MCPHRQKRHTHAVARKSKAQAEQMHVNTIDFSQARHWILLLKGEAID